jgi:hypothetical protein
MSSGGLLQLKEQLSILRGLLPIFDCGATAAFRMTELGFRKFAAVSPEAHASEFSQEDIELSELVTLERAKEQFAWPFQSWPDVGSRHEAGNLVYRSPLLESLRTQRETCVEEELGTRSRAGIGSWEFEIDPVLRQNMRMAALGREIEVARRRARDAVLETRRRFEIETLSSTIADEFETNAGGCRALFREVMLRKSEPIGFSLDQERGGEAIYFSKSLAPQWDLSLVLMRLDWWGKGSMDVLFAVLPRVCKKRPRSPINGDFLFVDYPHVLPSFGFYNGFGSLRELEVNVRAYLNLYGILAPVLEPLLSSQLPR